MKSANVHCRESGNCYTDWQSATRSLPEQRTRTVKMQLHLVELVTTT